MTGADAVDPTEVLERLRARVARAARFAPLSGVAGSLIGVVGAAVLLLADGGTTGVVVLCSLVVGSAAGMLGAALGHRVGGGRLDKAVHDATGYDVAAERIRRAIRGEPEALSPEETLRADHAAEVAVLVLPAQRTREVLMATGLSAGWIALLVVGVSTGQAVFIVLPLVGLLNVLVSASRVRMLGRQIRAAQLLLRG